MKKILAVMLALSIAFVLFGCKKEQVDETPKPIRSAETADDVFCLCAEFDSDADLIAKLTEAGYEMTELAKGSFKELNNYLITTDDSDVFIYVFDDAYLAGKAYSAILAGECDGAYATNFMALAGSLVRIGRYVIDDNLHDDGTGKTIRKVLELAEVNIPTGQAQTGFETRVVKSNSGVKKKAFLKDLKGNGFTTVKLAYSLHGATESYLILCENGILAGRLDVTNMESEGMQSYYEAISEAYNKRVGIAYTSSGLVLVTWNPDCMNVLVTAAPAADASDTASSGK